MIMLRYIAVGNANPPTGDLLVAIDLFAPDGSQLPGFTFQVAILPSYNGSRLTNKVIDTAVETLAANNIIVQSSDILVPALERG